MNALRIIQFAIPVMAMAVVILSLVYAKKAAKAGWNAGYWTGKSDVHQSLNGFLLDNAKHLTDHPEDFAVSIGKWLHDEMVGDRALAIAQGMDKERA